MPVATIASPREAPTVADQLSAKVDGEKIKLTIKAENGQEASFALGRYDALTLLVAIGKMANGLASDRSWPLDNQKAVLKLKDPSFQVGINHEGAVILAIRPHSFPDFEFELDAAAVSKLIEGLEKVSTIPSVRGGAKH